MTNWKPVGVLGVLSGIASWIGIIDGISIIFTAPIGIVCGVIAMRKGYKSLGWISIGLNILAPIVFMGMLYHYGWLNGNFSD